MRRLSLAAAALALAGTLQAPASAHFVRHDATVEVAPAVALEASLYVPTGAPPGGKFPLIVRQHGGGSNKDNPYDTTYGLKAVETGKFALLMYSHRGHGGSGGIFDFFGPDTTADFSKMLDWVATNFPEVDASNVGVSGYSQGGGESLLPAQSDPRVKAAAVGNTFADLNQALNPGDCFKFSFATGIFLFAYKLSASRTDDTLAFRWGAQLYTDTEDVGAGPVPSTTEDLASRSPLAGVPSLVARRVPVFWTQSWEDQLFPADHPERILKPLEDAGVPVHYWFASGGHAAGPNFLPDEEAKESAIVSWFEQFLLGEDNGFASGAKVDYWQRVTPGLPGTWAHKTADSWPLAEASPLALFPSSGGALADAPAGPGTVVGRVVNDLASVNVANDAITNEVARNIPGLGDAVRSVPEGASPLDTIAFSRELVAPLEVTGAPELTISLRSTARRVVQLSPKLWDVGEDGAALVNRGCLSVEIPAGDLSLERTVGIKLWPNSHVFPAGHTLVLTLSAVDFPTFKPDTEPAVTEILAGSSLTLPVVS